VVIELNVKRPEYAEECAKRSRGRTRLKQGTDNALPVEGENPKKREKKRRILRLSPPHGKSATKKEGGASSQTYTPTTTLLY